MRVEVGELGSVNSNLERHARIRITRTTVAEVIDNPKPRNNVKFTYPLPDIGVQSPYEKAVHAPT